MCCFYCCFFLFKIGPAGVLRVRPDPEAARSRADAGGRPEMGRQLDLEDRERARGHPVRGVQGGLRGGVPNGL